MRWLVVALLCVLPGVGLAQSDSATEFANAINKCRGIRSGDQRLECFDQVSAGNLTYLEDIHIGSSVQDNEKSKDDQTNNYRTNDPYASQQLFYSKQRFKSAIDLLEKDIQTLTYAVSCGVVFKSAAEEYIGKKISYIERTFSTEGVLDEGALAAIASKGLRDIDSISSQGSNCTYWHDNPDAVSNIRNKTQLP